MCCVHTHTRELSCECDKALLRCAYWLVVMVGEVISLLLLFYIGAAAWYGIIKWACLAPCICMNNGRHNDGDCKTTALSRFSCTFSFSFFTSGFYCDRSHVWELLFCNFNTYGVLSFFYLDRVGLIPHLSYGSTLSTSIFIF